MGSAKFGYFRSHKTNFPMMRITLFALALLAAAQFFACKSAKHTADKLPAEQIRWGSGGGFTGKETSFALLENGQVFQFKTLDGSTTERASIKAKTARGLFSTAKDLALRDVRHEHPGNMYFFLELRDGAGTHRITWSDAMPVEQKAKDFYMVLQQLLQAQK